MAGTAVDWNVLRIAKTQGQIWANLAIPGAAARLTLHTDGTPESVANPSAKHLGMTREGAKFMVKPGFEKYYADEFLNPIKTDVGQIEAAISAELLQVWDTQLLALLTPGTGTRAAASGYEEVSFGRIAIVYTSIAVIFPLEEDNTKFGIFHLYKALNEGGVEMSIGQKTLSGIPVNFVGHDITSRAVTDTVGKMWKQVA